MLKYFVYYFYRLISSLWRLHFVIADDTHKLIKQKRPLILAHWHGDELAVLHLVERFQLATMTSTSKDGDTIDFVINKLGGTTSRGSSTRGGVKALIGLVRLCRSGRMVSVAVDGPRGPIYQPKPGVFELSKLAQADIVPVGVFAPSAFVSKKSWNKIFLPFPFTRVSIYFGDPIPAVHENDDPKNLQWPERLKQALAAAKQHAAKNIAATIGEC